MLFAWERHQPTLVRLMAAYRSFLVANCEVFSRGP